MKFWGYKRPDGKVGIRNHVLILPASICASDTTRIIASQVEGAISFNNQNGCSQVPPDMKLTMDVLAGYARAYGITKLKWIVKGGENGQASARKALLELESHCKEDDIVIIHDAVRPLISKEIITDCIAKAREYGSGLSAVRCQETIMRTEDGESGNDGIDRNDIMRVQTPQAYQYGKALWAHREALNRGITNAVYTNTLMLELGAELHFSLGSNKNIKITTLEDIDIFKALYSTKRDAWLVSKKEKCS